MQRWGWWAAMVMAAVIGGLLSGVLVQAATAASGVQYLDVQASASVVHTGMSVALVGRASGVEGTLALVDETTGTVVATASSGSGLVTAAVQETNVTSQWYALEVLANGTVGAVSNYVEVDWTAQGNGTAAAYANAAGQTANAIYTLSGGADASAVTLWDTIGQTGMATAWYNGFAFGENRQTGKQAFTGGWKQEGYQLSDSFGQAFTALGGVTVIELTAYATPAPWGEAGYSPAKAYAPMFVIGGPPPAYGMASLYHLGQGMMLTGLAPDQQVWWAQEGLDHTQWFDQTATAEGTLTVPADTLGAWEFVVGTTAWYVDVES